MTEISLAWLMAKVTSPIVGATKLHHVEGAAKAAELKLSEEELSYLEELYLPHKLVGVMAQNTPAAAGQNLAENMREYHFFAVLFSMFSGVAGLFVSYYTNVAAGPTIVIFAGILYFATYFYAKRS